MSLPFWAELGGLVGTTLVVVRGQIFEPLRQRLKMLGCVQCAGWWVGALGGVALTHPIATLYEAAEALFVVGGLVSPLSMLTDGAIAWLDARAFDAEFERKQTHAG